jgi:hypothetical protein
VHAESEEVEADLLGDVDGLERVADRLSGGAVAAVGGAAGVAEAVDAEFKSHQSGSLDRVDLGDSGRTIIDNSA